MLNTIKAKSLKESGIITEYTSTKLVCLEKHGSLWIAFLFFLFPIFFLLILALIIHGNWVFSSWSHFFISMVLLFPVWGLVFLLYDRLINSEDIKQTIYVFNKLKKEIIKEDKTNKGNKNIEKYGFKQIDKILLKKVADDSSDTYYVLLMLSNKKQGHISIYSGGFSNKKPALDLAECINQFMNLPPDSIEMIYEQI